MIENALRYLVNLGNGRKRELELNGLTYTNDDLHLIREPKASRIEIRTLTGLIDYIKAELDISQKHSKKLLVQVESPTEVKLYSELNNTKDRECYISCSALVPRIYFDRFQELEQFNIMLQSNFVTNEDKKTLLKVTGNVKEEVVKNVGDDGVSQSVVMKSGVASVTEAIVPNTVQLAPYRTFTEIEQPTSEFVFRMKTGVEVALYEADGGAWRNKAMQDIKEYLQSELEGIDNVHIIS
jgi:hypothetical protein